ncbi:glycosyltransferase family 4 protein [candidate division KSB1 bacterium]|nr:glycosyltransferase family 4 protein [candidate division KSB1 bacterium]
MKVCVFTTVHRPDDVRVFHKEARSLAEAGHRVTLLAHADFERQEKNGVLIRGVKKPANRFFRLFNVFRFAGLCLKEKADVYHFHDFELLPVGLFLKLLTGRRVIYDCHENFPEAVYERVWYPDWVKPVLSRIIARVEPAMARRLDAVVCVVPDQQKRFDQQGCKTVLVRNLPRLENFDAAVNRNLPKLNRIIYLGGLTVVRGARLMVDMMTELKKTRPGVKLLWLGPFNEAHVEKDIKEYIRIKGVDENIEHIRLVPHEQVPDYVVRSLIGLIPWQPNEQMLRMIFPNKVFEYMACGIPVIASDLPSLKYIFGNADSGKTVQADNPGAFAKAVEDLLDSPGKMKKMGENGRLYVKNNYNWDMEADKLLKLYAVLER